MNNEMSNADKLIAIDSFYVIHQLAHTRFKWNSPCGITVTSHNVLQNDYVPPKASLGKDKPLQQFGGMGMAEGVQKEVNELAKQKSIKFEQLNTNIALTALLGTELYNRQMSAHSAIFHPGIRGPFNVKDIASSNFRQITATNFLGDVEEILAKERWQTPETPPETITQVISSLQVMVPPAAIIFELELCKKYNDLAWENRVFDHEWAHVLREFHEYCVFLPNRKGNVTMILIDFMFE